MTTFPRPQPLSSSAFGDDEPVFGSHSDLLPDTLSPTFGTVTEWPGHCLRRTSNSKKGNWKITFPAEDAVWNLRLREVAFALFNPAHRVLRQAEIFLPAVPYRLPTVRGVSYKLAALMTWSRDQGLPADLSEWDPGVFTEFLANRQDIMATSTVAQYVIAVRWLHTLAPVLTQGGVDEDPWDGRPAAQVAGRVVRDVTTSPVSPDTWWPLLRNAWTYIHVFGPDLLDLRDRIREADQARGQKTVPVDQATGSTEPDGALASPPDSSTATAQRRAHQLDAALDAWLADPANQVPVHRIGWRGAQPGEPIWATLSLTITLGESESAFQADSQPGRARRRRVLDAVSHGRARPVDGYKGITELGITRLAPAPSPALSPEEGTDLLRRWLAGPANRVPVRARADRHGAKGSPIWAVLARRVYGRRRGSGMFVQEHSTGALRRSLVEEVAATGRVDVPDEHLLLRALRIDCTDFARVTRADGSQGPWRESLSRSELHDELRTLRAAVYVFVAALSMMRDSEIQEIERGALTTHFGSPALRARKTKHEPDSPERFWWIIEPVAEAIAVAARLSWHPTHVFATIDPPAGTGRRGRRGIDASDDLVRFVAAVNAARDRTGLEHIPGDRIAPHMFRRTMAMLTGQEPDAEIALGLQLKHAARRALSNRTTQGYYAKDPAWAKEFDDQVELAAAAKLVTLLRSRQQGEDIAVGPAATRLHDGLDKVLDRIEHAKADPELRAQVMDDRTVALLLREEFPDLHWGTLNHCLWNGDTAECQTSLPTELRGNGPLLGMCQPAKCRNSVVTREQHGPIWLAEQHDLTSRLGDRKLSPIRRADLQARLDEVQAVTRSWDRKEAS